MELHNKQSSNPLLENDNVVRSMTQFECREIRKFAKSYAGTESTFAPVHFIILGGPYSALFWQALCHFIKVPAILRMLLSFSTKTNT
jgi:hypothetical protein